MKKRLSKQEDCWRRYRHVRGPILLLFGIAAVRGTTLANLGGFLPAIFVEKGLGLWRGGMANTVIFFSGAIGVMLGGILGDRYGKPKVITIGVGCALAGMVAFQLSSLEWAYISLAIIGAGVFVPMGVSVRIGAGIFARTPGVCKFIDTG